MEYLRCEASRSVNSTVTSWTRACYGMKKSIPCSNGCIEQKTLFFAGPIGRPGQDCGRATFPPSHWTQPFSTRSDHTWVAAPRLVALGNEAVRVIRLHVAVGSLALRQGHLLLGY